MKLERQFWTDAMQETIRPHIDCKLNCSSGVGFPSIMDMTWVDTKSCTHPVSVVNPIAYANMLNGNGFRIGDSRCVLNDGSETFYEPFYDNSATISTLSSGTKTAFGWTPVAINAIKKYHSIIVWNVKDLVIDVDATDDVFGGNVIASAQVTVALDEYADEYEVILDIPTMFPNWDSTYKGIQIYFTIPSGEKLFYAGYVFSNGYYFSWDNSDIVSIDYDESVELISGEVPHQTMSVTVYDEDGLFDPTNPDGYYDLVRNNMSLNAYFGIDDAYLQPTHLHSTGDVAYSKHQLTIEFDTEWQTNKKTDYEVASYIGNIGDDLNAYVVWTGAHIGFNNADFETTAATKELQWEGELQQLKLSSIGAFAVYNQSYGNLGALTACQASYLPSLPAEDYHVTSRDMRDTYAKLDRKPLLGVIKVSKYQYYITSEKKTLSMSHSTNAFGPYITFNLPEWSVGCARLDMNSLSAIDSNGNTISSANLTWNINQYYANNNLILRVMVMSNDTTLTLVDGSMNADLYYWTQESNAIVAQTINSTGGEECAIDNPFVTTDDQVNAIIDSVKYIYGQRDVYRAQWAQDWRVELGDIIYLDTQFEQNVKVVVTGLKFSYPGLWGEITMRRLG